MPCAYWQQCDQATRCFFNHRNKRGSPFDGLQAPANDPKRRIFNYILDEGLFISGGPVNNGGNVLQWFSANFLRKPFAQAEDFENFIEEALEIPAGSDGIVFFRISLGNGHLFGMQKREEYFMESMPRIPLFILCGR